MVVIPEGNLRFGLLCLSFCRSRREPALALAFLSVIPEGNLLLLFCTLLVIPQGSAFTLLQWQECTAVISGHDGSQYMAQHPSDLTADEQIDAALERTKTFETFPRIAKATYFAQP